MAGAGWVSGGILEIPVWIVFDNYDIELDADGIDLFTTLDAKCSSRRILTNANSGVSIAYQTLS